MSDLQENSETKGWRDIAMARQDEEDNLAAALVAVVDEAKFLIDRLDEVEWSGNFDETFNEYNGHVSPPLARLKSLIAEVDKLPTPTIDPKRAAAPQMYEALDNARDALNHVMNSGTWIDIQACIDGIDAALKAAGGGEQS